MTFNTFIDRTERVLDLLAGFLRLVSPKRPVWLKFAVLCIVTGAALLSAPWWLPFLQEAAQTSLGDPIPEAPFWLSAEFYGGLLIVFGIVVFVVFARLAQKDLILEPYIGTAVRPNETFYGLAQRLGNQINKQVILENASQADLEVPLSAASVGAQDAARILRSVAKDSRQKELSDVFAVETKTHLFVGKGNQK